MSAQLAATDALDALRILCGLWFLPHIFGKARNYVLASGTFAKAGLRPARFFVGFTMFLEVLACAGLVLGIQPRIAALLGVVVLAGAAYAVVRINGANWRWQKRGPEYMVFWAIACGLSVSAS